jgi:hypothetical protein
MNTARRTAVELPPAIQRYNRLAKRAKNRKGTRLVSIFKTFGEFVIRRFKP